MNLATLRGSGQQRPIIGRHPAGERDISGGEMPYYRSVGEIPPQAPHPVPPARRRPLRRGADGPGGLLLRLVAALPPVPADRDRGRRRVRPARLVTPAPTGRSSRATCAPTSSTAPGPTRCSGRQHLLANDDCRISYVGRRPAVPALPQRHRRRVPLRRGRARPGSSRPFGVLDVGRRRLRHHPHLGHPPHRARPATVH